MSWSACYPIPSLIKFLSFPHFVGLYTRHSLPEVILGFPGGSQIFSLVHCSLFGQQYYFVACYPPTGCSSVRYLLIGHSHQSWLAEQSFRSQNRRLMPSAYGLYGPSKPSPKSMQVHPFLSDLPVNIAARISTDLAAHLQGGGFMLTTPGHRL